LRNLPFLWRRGVPRSPEYSWGQVPADKLYVIASNYSASSCFGKNTGQANADGYRSGVFASGISAAGQTGCGAALRNTRPAKSCSSIENHHADLQPERWPVKQAHLFVAALDISRAILLHRP
jgi:hypothetical protein